MRKRLFRALGVAFLVEAGLAGAIILGSFLIYTKGRVTFTPEGTIATRTGAVTDVCAELS